MRESIGLGYIVTFIITFSGIFIIIFAGSLAYSKAFKVKNKIVNIIEENGSFNDSARSEIEQVLAEIGYRVSTSSANECEKIDGMTELVDDDYKSYHYCVYKKDTQRGTYYKVITYMYFDFPVVGSHLEIPVSGETRVLGDIFD